MYIHTLLCLILSILLRSTDYTCFYLCHTENYESIQSNGDFELFVTAPPCDSNTCLNGGACTNTANNDEFVCDCLPGFDGVQCQTVDKLSVHVYPHIIV